jgi:hypothetical protein
MNVTSIIWTSSSAPGEWDNTRHESYRLSEILNSKGIKHWLDDEKWRARLELLARHAAALFVEELV